MPRSIWTPATPSVRCTSWKAKHNSMAPIDGTDVPAHHLIVPSPGTSCGRLRAKTPLKAMLLGGEPLDGPHHRWWNFVSSSKERTEQLRNIVQGLFH